MPFYVGVLSKRWISNARAIELSSIRCVLVDAFIFSEVAAISVGQAAIISEPLKRVVSLFCYCRKVDSKMDSFLLCGEKEFSST